MYCCAHSQVPYKSHRDLRRVLRCPWSSSMQNTQRVQTCTAMPIAKFHAKHTESSDVLVPIAKFHAKHRESSDVFCDALSQVPCKPQREFRRVLWCPQPSSMRTTQRVQTCTAMPIAKLHAKHTESSDVCCDAHSQVPCKTHREFRRVLRCP